MHPLRPDLEAAVMASLPAPCRIPARFLLSTEISTISKKGDRIRKIHHLIYGPDFATIEPLQASLARIGNIASEPSRHDKTAIRRDSSAARRECGHDCLL